MFKRINLKYKSQFDRQVFGDRIREARMRLGYTQDQVADAVDQNKGGTFMSNIEAWNPAKKDEGSGTTIKAAVSIANALEVSLDYLCNRDDFINRPVTMGDIARVLMILPFLDEMHVQLKYEDITGNHTEGSFGSGKRMPTFQIKSGPLRKFFCDYEGKLTRANPEDFLEWLRREMKKLEDIPAWNARSVIEWQKCADKQTARDFPEDKLQELIWNRNPDYDMELEKPERKL